ncbi:phosphatase PAP2 family protein [bacterium]|nr:phosphatase PAP2 family protein [bacterium]
MEKRLTFLIARDRSHPELDRFMVILSDPYRWLIPSLIFVMILIYINWANGLIALVLGGVAAGIADSINTRFIKKYTNRIRPGKQYPEIRSLGIMNRGKKSFPSNHASNTMSFALGFGLIFPGIIWVLLPLSLLVGYSRVYCGAHFPLDVVAGWLHGALWITLIFSFSSLI